VTVAVTVVFSYIALSDIDFHEVWRALRSCDWWWLVPALIAFGLGDVARALRWRSLFAPGRRPPAGVALNATMIGRRQPQTGFGRWKGPKPTVALRSVRIDRQGRVHGEDGRFSAVLWRVLDSGGRRITLTQAALCHARGEDEQGREIRAYLTGTIIRDAVARGERYADEMPRRERLVAGGVGPSAHLVVVVEMRSDAGTVVTAYAMRRMPDAWRQL
jgi:hypothetical protein